MYRVEWVELKWIGFGLDLVMEEEEEGKFIMGDMIDYLDWIGWDRVG